MRQIYAAADCFSCRIFYIACICRRRKVKYRRILVPNTGEDMTGFSALAGYTVNKANLQEVLPMAYYAGFVMILSFSVEIFLLIASEKLCGCKPQWENVVLAAILGGLFAGVCLLPEFRLLTLLYWRFMVLLVMSMLAFGITRETVWKGAVFFLLNIVINNLSVSINLSRIWQLLLCGVLIALLSAKMRKRNGQGTVPVEIVHNDVCIRLTALRDTGNKLLDPITGKSVLIIGADAAQKLTGLTKTQLRTPVDTMQSASMPGLRLIPYHTIGQERGLLLAMKMQKVRIANKMDSCLVAFAPEGLGGEMKYQALTGGII